MKNDISIPIKCRYMVSMLLPVCPPISLHQGGAPPDHRNAQDACTQAGLFPKGFHSAANHPPPPPVTWCQLFTKIQMHQRKRNTFHWDIVASLFYLPALHDFLIKDSKLITDSISIRCQAQGCHGVQEASWRGREIKVNQSTNSTAQASINLVISTFKETGFTCQSTKASVAQASILLHVLQLLHIQTQLRRTRIWEPGRTKSGE